MNITITGPRSVGKSTISKLLSKKIKYNYISSDALMNAAMKKFGGLDKAIKIGKTELMSKGPAIVEKALSKDKIIFDLAGGAISSKQGFEIGVCQKVIKTITDKSIIIGLLPFANDAMSINLLYLREQKRKHFSDMDSKKLSEKTREDYLKLNPILKSAQVF
ncbi:MAG TPA: hypothetical protein HA224_05085 [Nanoarchaeota archaeon]|nr:hypothetical protein [Nanoarchaeota archaeon]